ncbi:GNAT family N-acetyltransferase [Litchfieldia salsa]|uniref:Protein N-acetyltransferase, RimJ/RimL family n=1 Tax=Litchfieldia salsa TaxID=930152 RepID=A0A1H0U1S8_9BACI|nr:GNAT family N-acetyltransferase [Litchfieldia salsa]SDP59766.1 Protein N-acetyltransferase, RimJ/RimL family [Litchfieldia salsa]
MIIREIVVEDAEGLGQIMTRVESESDFMMYEAGERKTSTERQKQMIENLLKSENSTIFVAEEHGNLIGYLFAIGGSAKRNKHSAYIVIGIAKVHTGKGIGTSLFQALEKWAKEQEVHRLELTVITNNKAGLSLYQKMGFEIEGTKRDSLYMNGQFVNEYYMSKLLETNRS